MYLAINDGNGWGKGATRSAAIAVAKSNALTYAKVRETLTWECIPGQDAYVDRMGYVFGVDPNTQHHHYTGGRTTRPN